MENLNQTQEQATAETQTTERKEIRLSELAAYVEAGKKREDIMETYGLNNLQVTKLMKEAGLKFRKFQKPAFTLIRDIEVPQAAVLSEENSTQEEAEIPMENVLENNAAQNQEVAEDNWV